MKKPLIVLLTHQEPDSVQRMRKYWATVEPEADILIAYGGCEAVFERLAMSNSLFVRSDRLALNDLQRELQSYSLLWRLVSDWLNGRPYDTIFFAEYDYVPTCTGFLGRNVASLRSEGADVCGYQVQRIDGTNHPHYLYHRRNPRLFDLWSSISVRSQKSVVLSMWGMASLWTREAFDSVAAIPEDEPAYLELWLPTVAHHLGFRVRGFAEEQHRMVAPKGDFSGQLEAARMLGVTAVHPAKRCWLESADLL